MFKKRITTLLITSILALVALGIWIFLSTRSNAFAEEAFTIESDTVTKAAQETYFASVRNAFKGSKVSMAAIDARFIDKDGVPKYIDMLESKAAIAGVRVDFGSIDIAQIEGGQDALRIRITGSGTWAAVTAYITALETLPFASKIEGVTLQKTENTSNKSTLWSFGLDFIQHIATKK